MFFRKVYIEIIFTPKRVYKYRNFYIILWIATKNWHFSRNDFKNVSLRGAKRRSNPDTLVGTYEITFFATNGAGVLHISTDCAKYNAEYKAELLPATECNLGQVDNMTGEGTISKDSRGNYQIITKVQIAGGIFDNPNDNKAVEAVKAILDNNKYNYTVYPPIPATAINTNGINVDGTVKGTSGRNLSKKKPLNDVDTYKFVLKPDGPLLNEMTNKSSGVDAEVRVIMKKKNDLVIALDENTPYTNPAITGFLPVAQ